MNEQMLREVVTEAWARFSAHVDSELTRHITEPKWPWPRGESPRDIVDSNDLRNSQTMAIDPRPGVMVTKYQWGVGYAPAVHDGAVFKATGADGLPRTMPGRPWTRELIKDRVRLQKTFKLHFTLSAKRRMAAGSGAPAAVPPAGGAS
jgi:hypothetical protein